MRLPVILFVLTCFFRASASDDLSFIIADAETREPLPYVGIGVAGLPLGEVYSDSTGHITLSLAKYTPKDSLHISCLGYLPVRIPIVSIQQYDTVFLQPAMFVLEPVHLGALSLTAESILLQVQKRFPQNHGLSPFRQQLYFHDYTHIPFARENRVQLKQSTFTGLSADSVQMLLDKLPDQFIDYQDLLLTLYKDSGQYKLVPTAGISLEQRQMPALIAEAQFRPFVEDLEKGMADKDVYYKIRTGILGKKFGHKKSYTWPDDDAYDSLYYTVETQWLKPELLALLRNYASIDSDNWEFVTRPSRYMYSLTTTEYPDGNVVWRISFTPRRSGLFEGYLYVDQDTYGILEAHFSYASGRETEKFRLAGFGHALRYKEGHVLFEKDEVGYFIRYLAARQKEWFKLDRNFSITKKQKRFLFDKTLSEVKLTTDLSVEVSHFCELLSLHHERIGPELFTKTSEPTSVRLRMEYGDWPQLLRRGTPIAPVRELEKYRQRAGTDPPCHSTDKN